ncbi:hypothetical protein TSOC_009321 [Tetrabaena socialis]|uniref:Uncharacterized protein n=1 Tax=Tetrabaena socialis TaxID=47790 RepID=A0A2J7ZW59_9CHLO|nr:hypothetical protein TSOC_009321 [Tetrabaena socialis]|eukprot:PNH04494.1 hypothetical protein TSOC_009321 [Tetrabaena socialis]
MADPAAPGGIQIEGTGKFYYPSGATYEGQWKLLNPPLPPPVEDPKEAKKKKAKDEPPPPPPEPPKRVRHGEDNLNPSPETDSVRARSTDVGFVALSFGVLAALLHLSATLYDQGVPYWQIHAVLGTAAAINWKLFDGTRQGLGLALLCGLGAPAAELVLLKLVPLWHYPRGDLLGGSFVSWVFWCYFAYMPALGSMARYLWSTMREMEQQQQQQQQQP